MPIAASVSASVANRPSSSPVNRGVDAALRDDVGHRPDRRDRQIRVHRQHFVAHGAHQGHRIASGAHDERHVADRKARDLRELRVRPVELFLHHRAEAVVLEVADDADDGDPGPVAVAAHADAMAHRVAVLPVHLRQRLVDDGDGCRVGAIGRGEPSARDEALAQSFEGAVGGDLPVAFHVHGRAPARSPPPSRPQSPIVFASGSDRTAPAAVTPGTARTRFIRSA